MLYRKYKNPGTSNHRSNAHRSTGKYKQRKYPSRIIDSHSIHTMDPFNQIFEYLPVHRIAVCKTHKQGIIKSQLGTHLNTKHQEYTAHMRRKIIVAVEQASSLQPWASQPDDVVYPSRDSAPLPHLPVYKDGLQCERCDQIVRQKRSIQRHCRTEHGWGTRGSGIQPMWTVVACQKLHGAGPLGQLFQVNAEQAAPSVTFDPDSAISQAIDASFTQATAQLDELDAKNNDAIEADTNRYEYSQWLARAGWARHLKGLSREWLLTMAKKPAYSERALFEICLAVRMVIWRAQQVSQSSAVGMPAMMYINRREFGGDARSEKPFNASQTRNTMIKYSNIWLEIIAYIWRTHELPVVSPRSDEEVEGHRPPYHMSGKQNACMDRIKRVVGNRRAEDWFEELEDSEEDDIDDAQQEELEGHVLEFILSLMNQGLGDDEYNSALLSGLAVLGISGGSGWLNPLIYTPKQSAIITTTRMLVLYRAHQFHQSDVERLTRQGYGLNDAKALAQTILSYVQEMASQFMTLMQFNGRSTPMDTILRLRSFGLKIRFTTNSEGVIDWIGETLLYGHVQFSMPQLRSMIHGMIASAQQHIWAKLMLLQVDNEGAVTGPTALPDIHWDRLVDNAAEQRVGWSFMDDPRNKNATSVDDPKQWLRQHVVNEKTIRCQFVDTEASRAALATGRRVVWVKDRVQAYGQAMREARRMLAALVHMTGGAPPRATELVTVQYRNSVNGDSRGIFIEDGLVVFVTKYHKNIGQTGQGKVIHRYVPREVGALVVYYLWFITPFWWAVQVATYGKAMDRGTYMWEPQPEA